MKKVVTVTFNPCIDKNTTIDKLVPEKKLRCTTPTFGPGGGGINVSRALKALGMESTCIYPFGGYTGMFLNELVQNEGIHTTPVQTKKHTRENLIVYETTTNNQYRFGMPGNSIEQEEWEQILEIIKEISSDYIVVSGSLMPGMPADIVARVAEIAKEKNSKLVLDTSGEALLKAVEVGVYLLKPNLGELSSLVGKEEINLNEVDQLGLEIIERGLCELLVVSMGEKGAKMISRDGVYHVQSPEVYKVSTLGAGDSMVAGIIYGLSEGKSFKEALQLGVAAGTAATMTPGSELCRKEDVEMLYRKIADQSIAIK